MNDDCHSTLAQMTPAIPNTCDNVAVKSEYIAAGYCGSLVKDDNHSPVEPECVFEVERDAVKKELKHVQFLLAHLTANFDRLEAENKALKGGLLAAITAANNLRTEHKAHGHITDSSAEWAIVVEPRLRKML